MTSVGIRELRQRASELLRMVERGETIEITDRGRPVAVLAPTPEGSGLAQLRASGQVEAATADFDDLAPPLVFDDDRPAASEILDQLRRDER